MKSMKPSSIEVNVQAIVDLSPHMRRITLKGQKLALLDPSCVGGYVKLFFDGDSQDKPSLRTYTIRSFNHESCSIDVDFVLHGGGLASSWAKKVSIGDVINVAGPGPRKMVNHQAEWFFLIGDLSALPALAINLEAMKRSAVGYALIIVNDIRDCQTLDVPPGIAVEWIVSDVSSEAEAETILSIVQSKPWLTGLPSVWVAGEYEIVKQLRRYFKIDNAVPKENSYCSSYWKQGLTDTDHKIIKRQLFATD